MAGNGFNAATTLITKRKVKAFSRCGQGEEGKDGGAGGEAGYTINKGWDITHVLRHTPKAGVGRTLHDTEHKDVR